MTIMQKLRFFSILLLVISKVSWTQVLGVQADLNSDAPVLLSDHSSFNGGSFMLPMMQRFKVVDGVLYLGANLRIGDHVSIASMQGRMIFSYSHVQDISRISLPCLKNGMYLVTQLRNGVVIRSNTVGISGTY